MHFQIFIPNVYGGDPAALNKIGLADLNDGRAQCVPTDGTHGPDGQGGLCVAWPRADQMRFIGCQPDKQTWIPAVPSHDGESGRYWVGFWNDSPPTADDLVRPPRQLLRGESVELGDGGQWLVPCYKSLPHEITMVADGAWLPLPKPQYSHFYEMGQRWSRLLLNQAKQIEWAEIAETALMLLRVNYRMTPEVLCHLHLLDTATAIRPILAFIGVPTDIGVGFKED